MKESNLIGINPSSPQPKLIYHMNPVYTLQTIKGEFAYHHDGIALKTKDIDLARIWTDGDLAQNQICVYESHLKEKFRVVKI